VVPVGLKLVHWVHAEALAVIVAVMADFVFNLWDLEFLPYYRIRHIPWCVRCHTQSLRLEAFEYFYVGRGLEWPNQCAIEVSNNQCLLVTAFCSQPSDIMISAPKTFFGSCVVAMETPCLHLKFKLMTVSSVFGDVNCI
jgi:hypothetical protein